MEPEQQPAWLRGPEVPRNPYDSVSGMLPSEDVGDMFPPHILDSNASAHMNGYYNQAARAMHSYRPSHGMFNLKNAPKFFYCAI